MLSAFPAIPSSDGLFGVQFPSFDPGFPPWDFQEPFFSLVQQEPPIFSTKPQEPVVTDSGSENLNPKPVTSSSGSGDSNRNPKHNRNNSGCGSDEPNRKASVQDERKRRRMISNRESARRSRMRKQKQLENLRNHVSRLRITNRELMNRLRIVTQHCHLVRIDNERLSSESAMLREKLWAVRQVLLVRELGQISPFAWPCSTTTSTSISPQNPPPS
ncbi:bZIP transcription factor 44-like [Diospyros lotus]|uniref:bZIP transcription factor 44-like n=1 Tax=Diospyros lotus TaxID=55363 RepID=UPI00224DA39F|nr:bZIP transcription factor 44-like [Diospyros lotus]